MARLEVTVPEGTQNILGIATINAPVDKVFQAFTDRELFARWWCRGNPMRVLRFDCRDGGGWHVVERSEDGHEYEFMGSFHEIAKNERIVQTFEFLGMPERGQVMLEKAEFVAVDSNTTEVRTVGTVQSQEARDAMVASALESGWRQSVEALGRLVESST